MTGTVPDPSVGRRWAAEQLGVSPDASPAEVRAAFLRRLAEADFTPPTPTRQAWRVLSGRADPPPEVLLDAEDRLRTAVEDFAAAFWSFPVEERRRRWADLSARAASWPALRSRLRRLEAGLGVPAADPGPDGSALRALATGVREVFVLRPAEQAAARQPLLQRAAERPGEWQDAARQLRKHHPQLAALQPELVGEVGTWENRQQDLARQRRRLRAAPPLTAQPAKRSPNRLLWLVVVMISVGATRLGTVFTPSSRPPPVVPPSLSPPGSRAAPVDGLPRDLRDKLLKPEGPSEEDLKKLGQEIERQKRELGVEEHPARANPKPP